MKIAIIKQHGGFNSIVFEEKPIPAPKADEVLVKVKACGLNHLDTWVRRGVPGHKFPLPLVPGSDITGVVEQVGPEAKLNAPDIKPGSRIIINPGVHCGVCNECKAGKDHLCAKWGLLGETRDGGCQEYISVPGQLVHTLPSNLTFEQGACIPIAYVTAWQMLVGKAKVQQGETILIHAAGSGVSVACIQIARKFGLQIYVTSTSDDKLQHARNLGAHRFINSKKEPFREAVKNLTAKQGVDVVVDHIGGEFFMDSIRCLKRGGRLVSCGATAGSELNVDWKHVFFKNLALLGSTYGPEKDFVEVLGAFQKGQLSPIVDQIIRLEELPKGHEWIETRKVFGKVVVKF
jgi:NADPH:quinone reductase-like Zn-dependent oxidoreductase